MKKLGLAVLLASAIMFSGCTDKVEAKRVLKQQGYTNIDFTGYSWMGCSKDDAYHTGFIAVLNGRRIEGTVCSGLLFKGSTIRF